VVGEEHVPQLVRDREADARRPTMWVELDARLLSGGRHQTRIVEVLTRDRVYAGAFGELKRVERRADPPALQCVQHDLSGATGDLGVRIVLTGLLQELPD
jgi:hypothetical protein